MSSTTAATPRPVKPTLDKRVANLYHYLEAQPGLVDKSAAYGLRDISNDYLREKDKEYANQLEVYKDTLPTRTRYEREYKAEQVRRITNIRNETSANIHEKPIQKLKKEIVEMITEETHPQFVKNVYEAHGANKFFDLLAGKSGADETNDTTMIRYFLSENKNLNNKSDQQVKDEYYKYLLDNESLLRTGIADPKDYRNTKDPRGKQMFDTDYNHPFGSEVEAYRRAHGYPQWNPVKRVLITKGPDDKYGSYIEQLQAPAPAPAPFTRLPTAPVMPTSTIPQAGAGRPMPQTKEEAQKALAQKMSQKTTQVAAPKQTSAFGPGPAYVAPPTSMTGQQFFKQFQK